MRTEINSARLKAIIKRERMSKDFADEQTRFNGLFWCRVFTAAYGSSPRGHSDPRWEELFRVGFKAHQELEESG